MSWDPFLGRPRCSPRSSSFPLGGGAQVAMRGLVEDWARSNDYPGLAQPHAVATFMTELCGYMGKSAAHCLRMHLDDSSRRPRAVEAQTWYFCIGSGAQTSRRAEGGPERIEGSSWRGGDADDDFTEADALNTRQQLLDRRRSAMSPAPGTFNFNVNCALGPKGLRAHGIKVGPMGLRHVA